jgi:hypothetical protein
LLLRNTATGQQTEGDAYVTRLIRRDTLFIHSSFGSENPKLTRAYGFGTATSKLIPYRVEPVVAGFRSQEFTIKVSRLDQIVATDSTRSANVLTPHPSPLPEGEGESVRFANDSIGGVA